MHPGRVVLAVLLSLEAAVAVPGTAAAHAGGAEICGLERLDAAYQRGRLSPEQYLLHRFQYGFAPESLPLWYRPDEDEPLKCATALIIEFESMRQRLSSATVATIESYLAMTPVTEQFPSPGGHFLLNYTVEGDDAVPPADIAPANGVPDFVDMVAGYLDEVWVAEIETHGFTAPPTDVGPVSVSFQNMQYYGYTALVDPLERVTRLVLNSDFEDFPPNDDPDGDLRGVVKVTAAHEFRHASQYAVSRWREGGWVELDAVWIEELVYDEVNDYYHYLAGESPVRRPDLSLDSGPGASGSYDDCVFQMWLQQVWGLEIVHDFWTRRGLELEESYLDSWHAVLATRQTSLVDRWGEFTAWNHGTGARSVPQVGYEEADEYPLGSVSGSASSYPYTKTGEVAHLAANAVRLVGFGDLGLERLHLRFDGQDAGGPFSLALHVVRRDGTGSIETIDLDDDNASELTLPYPAAELLAVGVVVGNPMRWGPARHWDLTADLVLPPPQPAAVVDATGLSAVLSKSGTRSVHITLTNVGEAGSELTYRVGISDSDPAGNPAAKTVTGSVVRFSPRTYLPGESMSALVTVTNHSVDDEFLKRVVLSFPEGVSVVSSTDFVGGGLGPLVCNGATGDGAELVWFGETSAGGFGMVRSGETAVADVELLVAPSFTGTLRVESTVEGDGFGLSPHTVASQVLLTPGDPRLTLTSPVGGERRDVADSLTVTWRSVGLPGTVDVLLSRDSGANWALLGQAAAASEQATILPGGLASPHARIRVADAFGVVADASSEDFTLFTSPDWLHCDVGEGRLAAGSSRVLEFTFEASGVGTGLHEATVVLEHDAAAAPITLPVIMSVLDDDGPRVARVRNVYPNPFNPATVIAFDVMRPEPLALDILDARGTLVRKLWAGAPPLGRHELPWDGRDDRGRPAPAGIYLARLRSAENETTVKMMLIR